MLVLSPSYREEALPDNLIRADHERLISGMRNIAGKRLSIRPFSPHSDTTNIVENGSNMGNSRFSDSSAVDLPQ